mmetsp:Transcript_71004/g.123159  ORF Transcript_71004/g.123159 Transcript_71004/m.123159 type:complete len:234 (-) Transcript_71004:435-1136(-)
MMLSLFTVKHVKADWAGLVHTALLLQREFTLPTLANNLVLRIIFFLLLAPLALALEAVGLQLFSSRLEAITHWDVADADFLALLDVSEGTDHAFVSVSVSIDIWSTRVVETRSRNKKCHPPWLPRAFERVVLETSYEQWSFIVTKSARTQIQDLLLDEVIILLPLQLDFCGKLLMRIFLRLVESCIRICLLKVEISEGSVEEQYVSFFDVLGGQIPNTSAVEIAQHQPAINDL